MLRSPNVDQEIKETFLEGLIPEVVLKDVWWTSWVQ